MRFVDEHRARLGVERICKALRVAPSTCWREKGRVDALLGQAPARSAPCARNPTGVGGQHGRVRRRQGLAPAAPCEILGGSLRGGTADAPAGSARGGARQKSVRTMVPDAKAACTLDRDNRELRAESYGYATSVRHEGAVCSDDKSTGGHNLSESRLPDCRAGSYRCCLARVEAGRKGAAKLDLLSLGASGRAG